MMTYLAWPAAGRGVLIAAVVLAAAPSAVAQQQGPHDPEKDPRWPAPAPRVLTRPANPARGQFLSVQVNTGAGGLNIVGDAANEPSIAVDPTAPNRIVIGWRQFDTIASNFRQAGYAWSDDGGRTWNPGVVDPGFFRSDPVIETDSAGNFYYLSLPSSSGGWRCELFKSTDGGRTWGDPVWAYGGDKAWMTVDKSGGVGDGHIYTVWNPSFGCCGAIDFAASNDGGATFESIGDIMPTLTWGTLAVGPDGEVYVGGRAATGPLVARSDDAKLGVPRPTFPQVAPVDLGGFVGLFGGVPNPGGLLAQQWVDVDRSAGPTRGRVYMLSTVDPPGGDPANVMISRSDDGGFTWLPPVRVDDDPSVTAYQWFGTMSVAPNGRVDAVWNDTRNGAGDHSLSETRYSYSVDGGQTWSASVPLGPVWDSHLGWPNQNKIGDYYDMVSDDLGAFLAYSTTYNGEQDVHFVRIGDYDCNGNGVGDAQDLASGGAADCNGNGIPDSCEIAAGAEQDANGDGVPDSCGCRADLDGDGGLTLNDFVVFRTLYAAGDLAVDFDGDGVLTLGDFVSFRGAYVAGC